MAGEDGDGGEGRGSGAAAAPGGDRDKGHSQTKRQRHRAQSGAVLGSYGQSGCARRSGKAWGALRGKTARSQLGKGAGDPGLSPGGATELLLHLRAGSAFTSFSSLRGDIRAMPCHVTCASPWPQDRVPGPFGTCF